MSRATVSPLTHARNLPTESNSTSCHPSIAMSHLAPSKPGDLFPGEEPERSEAVATVIKHLLEVLYDDTFLSKRNLDEREER